MNEQSTALIRERKKKKKFQHQHVNAANPDTSLKSEFSKGFFSAAALLSDPQWKIYQKGCDDTHLINNK